MQKGKTKTHIYKKFGWYKEACPGFSAVASRVSGDLWYRHPISEHLPIPVLAAPLLMQLPVNAHGKAREDSPSTWAPANHMGDPNGSCRLPASAWPSPECQENESVNAGSLCFYCSVTVPFKSINTFWKTYNNVLQIAYRSSKKKVNELK